MSHGSFSSDNPVPRLFSASGKCFVRLGSIGVATGLVLSALGNSIAQAGSASATLQVSARVLNRCSVSNDAATNDASLEVKCGQSTPVSVSIRSGDKVIENRRYQLLPDNSSKSISIDGESLRRELFSHLTSGGTVQITINF